MKLYKLIRDGYEVDYVEYPHEITQRANKVDDISKWAYETYCNKDYDGESRKTVRND